jgi:FkbM family methyltransferase
MFKIPFKYLLQKFLGFENYLYVFSIFSILRLRLHLKDKEFIHFLRMIPEDGNILDIGSNIGITAVPLAKKVSKGKIFCFEPIPLNVKTLKRIQKRYKISNFEIFETALGDRNSESTMVMPVFYNVKFQGFSHIVERQSDSKKGDLFRVPVQRLDDIPALQKLTKIDAIKIDVENFEWYVLKGAALLLERHKPIIYCELWDDEKRTLTMNYLKDQFGYRVRVFDNNQLVEFTNQPVSNFFFTR